MSEENITLFMDQLNHILIASTRMVIVNHPLAGPELNLLWALLAPVCHVFFQIENKVMF